MNDCTHIAIVTGYGSKGEGVARLEGGRVAFIRGAARGDICRIALVSERLRSCRAEISEIIQPSEHRIAPDCPAYPICGGCDFRHITYEEELRAKLWRVNSALERIGCISLRADEIVYTGQTDGYRNKAVLHVARLDGKSVIGFYRAGSHDICPVERCLLLEDELNDALRGLWNAPSQTEKTVTLRSRSLGQKPQAPRQSGPGAATVAELDGLTFQISRTSFFQVNNGAALLLYRKAREYAALSSSEFLVDLYCGVGSLTLFAGRDAGYALGVENNAAAVEDARRNALRNGLDNVGFVCADVTDWDAGGVSPDCVTVDPPRRGLTAGALQRILEMAPSRIVYLSCDPATLARDICRFNGYEAKHICVVDMFPRTANVECCVLLFRK